MRTLGTAFDDRGFLHTADIVVVGTQESFDMISIGVVPEGKEARKVSFGPMVAGPWAYSITLPSVMDNSGLAASERKRALRVQLGEEFKIAGAPGAYRLREPKLGEGDGPQLEQIQEEK